MTGITCPSCGRRAQEGDFLCTACETILDPEVLLEDPLPPKEPTVVRALLSPPEATLRRKRPEPPPELKGPRKTARGNTRTRVFIIPFELSDVPVVVAGLDLKDQKLSTFEAFALSMIDGRSSLDALRHTLSLGKIEIQTLSVSLVDRKLIKMLPAELVMQPPPARKAEPPAPAPLVESPPPESEPPSPPPTLLDELPPPRVEPPAPPPPVAEPPPRKVELPFPPPLIDEPPPAITEEHQLRPAPPAPPVLQPAPVAAAANQPLPEIRRVVPPGVARPLRREPTPRPPPPPAPPPRPEPPEPAKQAPPQPKKVFEEVRPRGPVPQHVYESPLQRAITLEKAGRMKECIAHLERAIEVSAEPAPLFNRLALVLLKERRDLKGAEALLHKALEHDPDCDVYRQNLLKVLMMSGATTGKKKVPNRW